MMRPSEYSSLQEELYLLLERKLSYPWSFALNFKQDCFSSKDCFSSNVWHQQHKQDCTEQNNWLCVYPAIRSPLSALSGLTLLASVGFLVPFFPHPLISPLKMVQLRSTRRLCEWKHLLLVILMNWAWEAELLAEREQTCAHAHTLQNLSTMVCTHLCPYTHCIHTIIINIILKVENMAALVACDDFFHN